MARAVGEGIFSEAGTLDELRSMVRDAVVCHYDENDRPWLIQLHLVHDELPAV